MLRSFVYWSGFHPTANIRVTGVFTPTLKITFYFTILDPETNQRVTLVQPETGEELDGWTFEDPNKKVAKKKSNIIKIDFNADDETTES